MPAGVKRVITILAATALVFSSVTHIEALTGRQQGCLAFENNRAGSVTLGFSGSSFDQASPITLQPFERRILREPSGNPIRASEDTVVWEKVGSRIVNRRSLRDDPNARFSDTAAKGCFGNLWMKSVK